MTRKTTTGTVEAGSVVETKRLHYWSIVSTSVAVDWKMENQCSTASISRIARLGYQEEECRTRHHPATGLSEMRTVRCKNHAKDIFLLIPLHPQCILPQHKCVELELTAHQGSRTLLDGS